MDSPITDPVGMFPLIDDLKLSPSCGTEENIVTRLYTDTKRRTVFYCTKYFPSVLNAVGCRAEDGKDGSCLQGW